MPISVQNVLVTGTEPIALADMKNALKIDSTDTTDDALISSLITAARQRAELITGRCIVTSNWVYYLDCFPYGWFSQQAPARGDYPTFMQFYANAQTFRIPKSPVTAVTAIMYQADSTGVFTTLSPSAYVVDYASEPCVVNPTGSNIWPYAYATHNAVQVQFTAGYGNNCPEPIKVAISLMVTDWWENRGDSATVNRVADMLLSGYRSQPMGYVR
jgi:hypothetical protein